MDGKLYCSPGCTSHVLRIDPATGATELIGDDSNAMSDMARPDHADAPAPLSFGECLGDRGAQKNLPPETAA